MTEWSWPILNSDSRSLDRVAVVNSPQFEWMNESYVRQHGWPLISWHSVLYLGHFVTACCLVELIPIELTGLRYYLVLWKLYQNKHVAVITYPVSDVCILLADERPSVSLSSRQLSGVDEGPGKCHSEGHVVRTASPVEASGRTTADRLVASTAVKITGVACPRDCEGQTSRGQGLNKSALSCLCDKMRETCRQNLTALRPDILTAVCHWWFKTVCLHGDQ